MIRLFASRNRALVVSFIFFAVASAAFETGLAFVFAELAKAVLGESAYSPVLVAVFAVLYMLPNGLVDYFIQRQEFHIQSRFATLVREKLIRHVTSLPLPAGCTALDKTAIYQSALVNDAEMISEEYATSITVITRQCLMFLASVIGIAIISPAFVPVAIGLSLLSMVLPKLVEPRIRRTQRELADSKGAFLDATARLLSGLESILTFGRFGRYLGTYREQIAHLEGANNARNCTRALVWTLTWVFGTLMIISAWGAGAIMAQHNIVTIAQVVALAQLMMQIAGPFTSISHRYAQLLAGREQLAKVAQLWQADPGTVPAAPLSAQIDSLLANGLRVEREEKQILAGLDFTVSRGERVLLRGPSGCGKTTLLRALAGTILADGNVSVNGSVLSPGTNRAGRIVLVTQQPFLTPGTLHDNLHPDSVGTQSLTPAAHGVLGPLTDRLALTPGAGVSGLSGGEGKRVHVARHLSDGPAALLLDEPTAGLDPLAAEAVLRALLTLDERPLVAVVHDLPADPAELGFTREVVMRDGKIVSDTPLVP
ncbi:ATP-binding cassette domain-containing protein [Dermabacteraceae bacterium P7054]